MKWDRNKERKAAKNMSIAGCIYGVFFLLVWCGLAVRMGAYFMLLFGIPGLGLMVYRLYACIQLTKEDKKKELPKETDPWDRPAVSEAPRQENPVSTDGKFCPYCGGGIQEGFEFCPKCGRRQP